MDRVLLVLLSASVWFRVAPVAAQELPADISAYEDLARAMEAGDWRAANGATANILRRSARSDIRESVECMHTYLLEIALADRLTQQPDGIRGLSRELRDLATEVRELGESYPICAQDGAEWIDHSEGVRRTQELSYLLPDLERAAQLATEAANNASGVSADLVEVFTEEYERLKGLVPAGPSDAWFRVRRLWADESPPEAQAREWPARGEGAAIATAALIAGFAVTSFFASATIFSRGTLPSLVAGSWGITFGLLPAFASAWTWEKRSRALLYGSMVLTLVGTVGGVAAVAQLDRRGRYFGRGLLIGAGVSVIWQIGGWIHYRYPDRTRRQWNERVSIAPTVGRRHAGFVASGSF